MNRAIGEHVRAQHATEDQKRTWVVGHAPGGPLPDQPALEHLHHRLVQRDPPAHLVAVGIHHALDEAHEILLHRAVIPAALLGEPDGQGVVVDRDHGLQTACAERIDHLVVMSDGLLGEAALARLDAAPFQ